MNWRLAPLLFLVAAPQMASAQAPAAPAASPSLAMRAAEVVDLLAGRGRYDASFAPVFRAAVPPDTFAAIAAQLKTMLGAPERVHSVAPAGPFTGSAVLRFAHGTASIQLTLDPGGAHQITGLLVTGTAVLNDSAAKLTAEFHALPGAAGFGIFALGDGEPRPIVQWRGEAGAPIGSAFKLWLLAEASRQVQAGERRWTDVVSVGPPSLPSGVLQSWPAASPVTLQTLATLMVSISDNTAADTMLALLGRDRVGALAEATRSVEAARTLPILSTREAFVIKGDPALTAEWQRGDRAGRTALLAREGARIGAAPLSLGVFGAGTPLASETVEWFASPLETARVLDWLRVHGDPTTLAILAVNGGTDAGTAARFGYVGFKGGSEPGVVSLDYLVRTPGGRWLAVTGNWHRADDAVASDQFAALMARALALAAKS